jgi:hypothetical protein
MTKKKSTPVKNTKVVVKPKVKPAAKPVAKAKTVVIETESTVTEPVQTVVDQVTNPPESEQPSTSVVVKTRKVKEMVVTPEMEKAIEEAKQLIKDEMNKAEAAREIYGMLKGHERRQIVHVFMVGCGLTKAGSGTYYQNCKK